MNTSDQTEPIVTDDSVDVAEEEQQSTDEITEYKERLQRSQADLENLRRRSEQERQTLRQFAVEGLVEELLPVVDNFYRATDHIPTEQQETPWVTGIQYIQKNLLDVLERRGLTEIQVKPGDHFDPSKHESIGTDDSGNFAEEIVAAVSNRGYLLHGKMVRPAAVVVGASPTEK